MPLATVILPRQHDSIFSLFQASGSNSVSAFVLNSQKTMWSHRVIYRNQNYHCHLLKWLCQVQEGVFHDLWSHRLGVIVILIKPWRRMMYILVVLAPEGRDKNGKEELPSEMLYRPPFPSVISGGIGGHLEWVVPLAQDWDLVLVHAFLCPYLIHIYMRGTFLSIHPAYPHQRTKKALMLFPALWQHWTIGRASPRSS